MPASNRRAAFPTFLTASATLSLLACAGAAQAQLRVAAWNISFYGGGRQADLTTAIFGQYQGRSLKPDVMMCLEFTSQTAVNDMLAVLNAAEPGQWAAAPFIDGPDSDAAFFYRTSKVAYLQTVIAGYGSSNTNNQPRNTYRYDIRLQGYNANSARIGCYAVHMKAQGGTNDAGRRLIESQRIRANAAGANATDLNGNAVPGTGLPTGYAFLVGGDFNVQSYTEPFYAELVGSQANNTGRFFDPINRPASWNNNGTYAILHTQDPAGAGGMDDRHDQILLSSFLVDGGGLDYIGNPAIPYSLSTWNDTNHSYRAWGNDGTSYNSTLTVTNNQMVGAAIAQSLINACNGAGHLPVVLDLRVPAKASAPASLNFGQVALNAAAQISLPVSNAGDVAKWTAAGISDLNYTLAASSGFSAPAGAFADAAGGGANSHTISMDTSSPGVKTGIVTIASDDPDQPTLIIQLSGEVVGTSCSADWDHNHVVDPSDIALFINDWLAGVSGGGLAADFDNSGVIDPADIAQFVNAWLSQLSGPC